jgi:integrase
MQIEPFPEKDGYRCWLSHDEQDQLLDEYSEEPRKQVALRGLLHGLRSDEIEWMRTRNIRRLESDLKAYKLRIEDGKTGYRETPLQSRLKEQMLMLKNARQLTQDDPLIDVTKRTVQRWVTAATEQLAEETGLSDWNYVSAHDLRRTWATHTYYALDAHYATEVVMRWGGWEDRDTFVENYLGRETDDLAAAMMNDAGLR